MKRVQRDDERALTELLERYRARLFAFLVRRTGDTATAEDLFQETWLRVVRARASFDPGRRFSTWLYQIANNLCRDRVRRRVVEERHRETVRRDLSANPRPATTPPLDLRLDMHRRVSRLPDHLREVVLLRYFHQLSEREIAGAGSRDAAHPLGRPAVRGEVRVGM